MRAPEPGPASAASRHRWPLRLAIGILIAAFALAAFGGPVAAAQPYSERFTDTAIDVIDCGSFDAILTRTFTGRFAVYFDENGDATRIVITASVSGSLENSETGAVLPVSGGVQQTEDLIAGIVSFSGSVFVVTEQGKGSVIKDVGRFVVQFVDEDPANDIILLEAGPHDAIDQGAGAFCDAIA
ncbi:MAG: hypothetical protein ACAH65_08685 [Chloroflexota bacterium]